MRYLIGLAVAAAVFSGLNSYARMHGDDWIVDLGRDAVSVVKSLQHN